MLSMEARKALGDIIDTEYRYGGYLMKVTWYKGIDQAQVTIYEIGARLPLKWSRTMTKTQANGAVQLFELMGFFEMA